MSPAIHPAARDRRVLRGLLGLALITALATAATAAEKAKEISDGSLVTLEYTLSAKGEGVIDSNVGKEPLKYVQGKEQIVPGLEKALAGLSAGDTKKVDIVAKDAFGEYDEKRRITVEKTQVPADAAAGQILMTAEGVPVKLLEVTDEKAVIDVNHPLAGKDLSFDVKVIAVEDAPAETDPTSAAP